MTLKIYGHPFASFAWKALIAAYERDVPFEFCMVDPDHPENSSRMAELSPTGQFPALIDGDRHVTQSNSVIEYLDRFGDSAPMIPDDRDAALDARMLAYIFDSYVSVPVQHIVGESLRPADQKNHGRVTEAKQPTKPTAARTRLANGPGFAAAEKFSFLGGLIHCTTMGNGTCLSFRS